MNTAAKLDLVASLSEKASEHSFILVAGQQDRCAILFCDEDGMDEPSVSIEVSGASPDDMKDVVAKLGRENVEYVSIPPLMVEADDFDGRKFDIAPVLYAFYHSFGDEVVGEMCATSFGGSLGVAIVALEPVVSAEMGEEIEIEGGEVTNDELSTWGEALLKSENPDVKKLGEFIKSKLFYFKDHDLEGNIYDAEGNIVGNEDDDLDDEDEDVDYDEEAPASSMRH